MEEQNANDIVVAVSQNGTELAAPSTGNFLEVIKQAATDPNVDIQKMHGLLDVQERMMNKQAEINFNIALGQLQDELPAIKKDARIEHKGRLIAQYATYETIDRVIRPLLKKYGFSLRFNSKQGQGNIIISATLSHKDGHSIVDEIPLSIDASGAKNSVQGVGSTIAYGKRYLVGMLLNLVFEGEDDDGQSASYIPITEAQARTIKDKIMELEERGISVDRQKFLAYLDADSIENIAATNFDKAVIALERKKGESEK